MSVCIAMFDVCKRLFLLIDGRHVLKSYRGESRESPPRDGNCHRSEVLRMQGGPIYISLSLSLSLSLHILIVLHSIPSLQASILHRRLLQLTQVILLSNAQAHFSAHGGDGRRLIGSMSAVRVSSPPIILR